MKSKKLFRKHVQPILDSGVKRDDFAAAMDYDSPGFVSMLMRDKYPKSLLSLNRLKRFAKVCALSNEDVMRLALARTNDGGATMDTETFKFLLKTFVNVVDARRAARSAA